jgi:hypothetical protein
MDAHTDMLRAYGTLRACLGCRYVDDTMRVSTDQDGNTFVYLRSS